MSWMEDSSENTALQQNQSKAPPETFEHVYAKRFQADSQQILNSILNLIE
jgi:hypothetical protein